MSTLDSVEALANELSQGDQIALVMRLGSKLNLSIPISTPQTAAPAVDKEGLRLAEQLLAEVEDMPDNAPGLSDLTEEIRRMREERHR
jgi:hypothetical protein